MHVRNSLRCSREELETSAEVIVPKTYAIVLQKREAKTTEKQFFEKYDTWEILDLRESKHGKEIDRSVEALGFAGYDPKLTIKHEEGLILLREAEPTFSKFAKYEGLKFTLEPDIKDLYRRRKEDDYLEDDKRLGKPKSSLLDRLEDGKSSKRWTFWKDKASKSYK